MSTRGIVTFAVEPDPSKRAVVTEAWCQDLLALGKPGVPLLLRCPIYAAPDNSFPTDTYKRALDLYHRHGFTVVGVLAQDFDTVSLNAPLGLHGELTLNAAIQEYTLRVEGVCRQLAPHGLEAIWLWNEPNLNDQPPIAAGGLKPTSLNPTVFGSLIYQGARRAKAAGIKRVYAGALSCLEQFHTNPAGDWVAGYLDTAFSYLALHGKHDLLVDVLSVNAEGWVGAPYAHAMADALRAVAARHGLTIQTAVGEWGWPGSPTVDVGRATSTFLALDGAFDEVFHFQHPLRFPHVPAEYGARDWVMDPLHDGSGLLGFYPWGQSLPWYSVLQTLFRT